MDRTKLINAGIDYEDGLRRMSGNQALYHKFLNKFLDDPSFERFQKGLSEKNMEIVYEAAHTLKGTSATLGISELSFECDIVCRKLQNRENDINAGNVCKAYEIAVQAIKEDDKRDL